MRHRRRPAARTRRAVARLNASARGARSHDRRPRTGAVPRLRTVIRYVMSEPGAAERVSVVLSMTRSSGTAWNGHATCSESRAASPAPVPEAVATSVPVTVPPPVMTSPPSAPWLGTWSKPDVVPATPDTPAAINGSWMLLNHGEFGAVRSTDGIPGTRPVSATGVLAVTLSGIEQLSWSGRVVSMPSGGVGAAPFSNSTPLTGLAAPGRAPLVPGPPFDPHQLSRASIDSGTCGRNTRNP